MTLLYTTCKWCRNVQDTSALVPKCLADTSALLTLRHWCRSVSDFYGGAEVSIGHFSTSAEMYWVRSVLGPKCPYTV